MVDEAHIQSQILLGECHVHLGNLLDTEPIDQALDTDAINQALDGDAINQTLDADAIDQAETNHDQSGCQESVAHYRIAVECFQRVQKLQPGALPEHFEDFLSDWLKDLVEE